MELDSSFLMGKPRPGVSQSELAEILMPTAVPGPPAPTYYLPYNEQRESTAQVALSQEQLHH